MPTTHTYTAPNAAVASIEIPDGYSPPDGLSLVKDGQPYAILFLHDDYTGPPEPFVPPGDGFEPTTTP